MSRRPAAVTQADIARALRAAQAAGPDWKVVILPGGAIEITRAPSAAAGGRPAGEALTPEREIIL